MMNKSCHAIELMAVCALLAGFFACGRSARVVSVFPDAATPGMIVRVTTDKTAFPSERPARIEMGSQTATIQQVVSVTEADALVPNLPAGQVQVQVREPGKKPGSAGQLTILPASSQQLILSFQNNSVSLMRAQPRAGEASRAAEQDQRRLSFDVLNAQGGLVFTGAVVHPTLGRLEIYDEPRPGERVLRVMPPEQQAVFAIKVPTIPSGGAATIKFYDVPPGVDLTTSPGRAARTLLNEIKLNQ